MNCIICGKECIGECCSGACRAKKSRRAQVEIAAARARAEHSFVDGTVYGRQAVSYKQDKFSTRPEPLNADDAPRPLDRGRYTRPDGTVYMFDSGGQVFEVVDKLVIQ